MVGTDICRKISFLEIVKFQIRKSVNYNKRKKDNVNFYNFRFKLYTNMFDVCKKNAQSIVSVSVRKQNVKKHKCMKSIT